MATDKESLDKLIDRITPENQHIPERSPEPLPDYLCEKCGEHNTLHEVISATGTILCRPKWCRSVGESPAPAPYTEEIHREGCAIFNFVGEVQPDCNCGFAEIVRLQAKVSTLEQALRAIRDDGMDAMMCMITAKNALSGESRQ